MKFTCKNVTFLNSYNFTKLPLALLPAAYGFEGSKGMFPHLLTANSFNKVLTSLPSKEDYGIDSMNPKSRAKFEEWYDQQDPNQPYHFNEEMLKYCKQDVRITEQAVMLFREQNKE